MNVLDSPVLGDTTAPATFIITKQLPGSVSDSKITIKDVGIGLLLALIIVKISSSSVESK